MNSHCLSDAEIPRLLNDQLAPEQLAVIKGHLVECGECRRRVAAWKEDLALHLPNTGAGNDHSSLIQRVLCRVDELLTETAPSRAEDEHKDRVGEQIGRYRILSPLGHGGMGVVWKARQDSPSRDVALKVIRAGTATAQTIARFEQESQALAEMNHPGITKVLDAGTTVDGQPYFAMELVDGLPLIDFCKHFRLPLDARLLLFHEICQAIVHAHQKGIIHRDLKPSNLLIEGDASNPRPKVIDFGIAQILEGPSARQVALTEQGVTIGTLRYMSPEQATGKGRQPVDTRADVYSLGVILYELLSGKTPLAHALPESAGDLLRQLDIVQKSEYVPPSQALADGGDTSVAHADGMGKTARALAAKLKSELDIIVMKAIRREPDRRYSSVEALAADIDRFREGLPIEAHPDSATYRVSKLMKKHRYAATLFFVIVSSAMATVVGTSYGMLQARSAERQANNRSDELRTAMKILQAVFEGMNPELAEAGEADFRDFLLARLKSAGEHLVSAPVGDSDDVLVLKAGLARALGAMGDQQSAIPLLENVLQTVRQRDGISAEDKVNILVTLGITYLQAGRRSEAERLLQEAKAITVAELDPQHIYHQVTDHYLATLSAASGDTNSTIEKRQKLLSQFSADDPNEANAYFDNLNSLAILYGQSGRHKEAIDAYRRCIAHWKQSLVDDHPIILKLRTNLATALGASGDHATEVSELEEILTITRRKFPGDSLPAGNAALNLATAKFRAGDRQNAVNQITEIALSNDSPPEVALRAKFEILTIKKMINDPPEEIRDFREKLMSAIRDQLGEEHPLMDKAKSQ